MDTITEAKTIRFAQSMSKIEPVYLDGILERNKQHLNSDGRTITCIDCGTKVTGAKQGGRKRCIECVQKKKYVYKQVHHCIEHTGLEDWHGTKTGYTLHKCRCDDCKLVWRDYIREYYANNERVRERAAKRHRASYVPRPRKPASTTIKERRHALWIKQDKLCALCHEPIAFADAKLDHDHSCCKNLNRQCSDCDRGVLHNNCNSMLAFAGDDPKRLLQGMAYLESFG